MNILAVFAHPDDELGCVGSLKKHAERGDKVMLVWTTHGELASQYVEHSDEEVRRVRHEHGALVAQEIGAEYLFFDMGDSRMTGSRDEALTLARLYARFKPDVVITWSDDNPHPDHRMTAKICFDAITLARIPKIINEGLNNEEALEPHRKNVRLYQYLATGQNHYPIVHVDISKQIETSRKLFSFYRDFYKWDYSDEDFLSARALKGREVGVKYAESFQLKARFSPPHEYL